MYAMENLSKDKQTADPKKYPQGYFKPKACKMCNNEFTPKAPSEHYCSDGCKDRGLTNAYLKRTYDITIGDYEQMLEDQKHLCKLCGNEGFTMGKHHKVKLVVDHCHVVGHVRGLLCHNCNRALGLLKDDTSVLEKAIHYLKGATTIQ